MKKIFTIVCALCLTAGAIMAQSNDSLERAKQQEAMLKQQQKEQQALQKQQQKEQAELQKEQQKAAEKAQKEQAKAEEKALKDEADRQKREEAKAANKARAEQKKIEKKQKRAANLAAWGRKNHFSVDPFVGLFNSQRSFKGDNLYNSWGVGLGLDVNYHYPIAKRWDVNVGLGYRYSLYAYNHALAFGPNGASIYNKNNYNGNMPTASVSTIEVPVKLSHVSKDNKDEIYLGLVPAFNIATSFTYETMNAGKLESNTKSDLKLINSFRLEVVLGKQSKWTIFAPGVQAYFNLMPAYVGSLDVPIHEFGIRLAL